jgi:hypothetical protein
MIGTILSALFDSVLSAVVDYLKAMQERRGLIKQGQAQQAAAETAESAKTQAAMAKAEAESPKTPDAALERLRDGTA